MTEMSNLTALKYHNALAGGVAHVLLRRVEAPLLPLTSYTIVFSFVCKFFLFRLNFEETILHYKIV